MNHQWKKASLQDLVKYNKYLLLSLIIVSFVCLILAVGFLNKEDKWVIFPSNNINNRMEISSTRLYASYLKPWAIDIAKEVFTTSPDEVEAQHARIMTISSSSKQLDAFFAKQLDFVKQNNASSVFYPKEVVLVKDGVLVNGALHYWFLGSDEKISLAKSYLISYKQTGNGAILLKNIEEKPLEQKK